MARIDLKHSSTILSSSIQIQSEFPFEALLKHSNSAVLLLVAVTCALAGLCLTFPVENPGQEAKKPAGQIGERYEPTPTADHRQNPIDQRQTVVISDEPKQVDPARFFPETLTKPATVEFVNKTLVDVAK